MGQQGRTVVQKRLMVEGSNSNSAGMVSSKELSSRYSVHVRKKVYAAFSNLA